MRRSVPLGEVPARFSVKTLCSEPFVIAARRGHPYLGAPGLEAYCASRHLVVSHAGDPHAFVDAALAAQGRSRRVALTVPNFMFALAALADTEMIAALPRRFVAMHGRRFGVEGIAPPLPLPAYAINLVVPRVALMDAGIAWLAATLEVVAEGLDGGVGEPGRTR